MKFLSKNASHILWAAVVVFIFLLFKCQSDKKSDRIKQIEIESAQRDKKHKADSVTFLAKEQRLQDSIHKAGVNSDLQVKVIVETEKKLQASQHNINRLTAIIRGTSRPVDSSFVLVSPEFKEACDSLPAEIDKQNVVIADLQKNNEDLVDLMNYEIILRDSLIEAGNTYRDSLRVDYNKQKGLLNEALKVGKPRGRLLGGVGIMGNQQYFLAGANAKLGYQDKTGKVYLLSGHVMKFPPMPNPQLMAELAVLFKF